MKKSLLGTLTVLTFAQPCAKSQMKYDTISFSSFYRIVTRKDVTFGLLIFVFTLLLIPASLQAQVKIGDNLANVNANSILELESTTKALLLPRLNQTQIDAMQNVPAGMLVYNSTTNVLNIRTSAGWTTLAFAANAASATNPWSTTGSAIYTTSSRVGFGTSQPFSQLSNNSGNTTGSDGVGGENGSFSWAANQQGYVGQFYNGATDTGNGLAVKVNTIGTTALDVSRGSQSGNATPLLTVKSNGKVGVKNSNPSVELDVNGTISATLYDMGIQYNFSDSNLEGGYIAAYTPGCPNGYKPIGGGGGHRDFNQALRDIEVAYSGPDPSNTNNWRLMIENNGSSTRAIRVYVICAKVN